MESIIRASEYNHDNKNRFQENQHLNISETRQNLSSYLGNKPETEVNYAARAEDTNADYHGNRGSQTDDESNRKYPDYCRTMVIKDSHGQMKELVFPKALDLDRPKRARTQFSAEQLYQLEREFQRNQYLVGKERTLLAEKLHLSETQVKVWFQNRRTKYKRDKQRDEELKTSSSDSLATSNIMKILQNRPSVPQVLPKTDFTLPSQLQSTRERHDVSYNVPIHVPALRPHLHYYPQPYLQ